MQPGDLVEIVRVVGYPNGVDMNPEEAAFFRVGTHHTVKTMDGYNGGPILNGPTGRCPFYPEEVKLVDV